MRLDVRTYLILTLLTATCGSLNTNPWIELGIMAMLTLLQLISGKNVFMPRLLCTYICFVAIQYYIFPITPDIISMIFSLFVVNIRSFFPTIMCIVLLYKMTKVSQMSATFSKMGVPKGFTITVAIAIRYIPALKEEWMHIREAMKMRKVTNNISNPFKKMSLIFQCYLIPLFVASINMADELSAAAVTRGIDRPGKPSCRNYSQMKGLDYIVIFICLMETGICAFIRYS